MPPFGFDDIFECDPVPKEPINPWSAPIKIAAIPLPDYADDENLKKRFGIELGKGLKPFEAASTLTEGNAAKALWISSNWLGDPIVIGSKDAYALTVKEVAKPLETEQLLAKRLEFADEREQHGRPLARQRSLLINGGNKGVFAARSGHQGQRADG